MSTEESRVPCLLDAVRQGIPYVVRRKPFSDERFFIFTHTMITVYVLKSISDNATYVGMAKDTQKRLKEHNSGKNRYTKGHMPWMIIYTEIFPDWESARVREKYFKTTAGKNWLKKNWMSTEESRVPCLLDAVRQGIPYVVQRKPFSDERFFIFTHTMITVYVLKSISDNAIYVGMAKDAQNRLKEHNSGKN